MKDASTALRRAYMDKLKAILPTYADEVDDTIAPYTQNSPPDQYFVVSNQNMVDTSNKCGFTGRYSIQVTTYTRFPHGTGNFEDAEGLNTQMMEAIRPSHAVDLTVNGFACFSTQVALSQHATEKPSTQYWYYKIITIFNHSISGI